jgi:hypothetical protein
MKTKWKRRGRRTSFLNGHSDRMPTVADTPLLTVRDVGALLRSAMSSSPVESYSGSASSRSSLR